MASIDTHRWIKVKDYKHGLPSISACYIISLSGEPIYVGKSVNLRSRFAQHQIDINRINGKDFKGDPRDIEVLYEPGPKDALCAREIEIIHTLRPRLNVCFNRGHNA